MEIAYVENSSAGAITVIVESREFIIGPGETKKIRGINYSGATIVLPEEERFSFNREFESMLEDWPDIQNAYVCPGVLCSKFSLQWTRRNEFLLLACNEAREPLVLIADRPLELSDDT